MRSKRRRSTALRSRAAALSDAIEMEDVLDANPAFGGRGLNRGVRISSVSSSAFSNTASMTRSRSAKSSRAVNRASNCVAPPEPARHSRNLGRFRARSAHAAGRARCPLEPGAHPKGSSDGRPAQTSARFRTPSVPPRPRPLCQTGSIHCSQCGSKTQPFKKRPPEFNLNLSGRFSGRRVRHCVPAAIETTAWPLRGLASF